MKKVQKPVFQAIFGPCILNPLFQIIHVVQPIGAAEIVQAFADMVSDFFLGGGRYREPVFILIDQSCFS